MPAFELTPRTILRKDRTSDISLSFKPRVNLDPQKQRHSSPNPIKRTTMRKPSISSYSSMGGNPFHEDRYTKLEDFYDEPEELSPHDLETEMFTREYHSYLGHGAAKDNHPQPTYRHNGMSHSLSEGNVDFRSMNREREAGFSQHRRLASDEILIQYSEDDTASYSSASRGAVSSSSSRGRSIFRTPSPSKLEDIEEASLSTEDVSMSAAKRHRSPVKQLFGEHGWLGASLSSKDLPGEARRKKLGLKEWRGKLKERVEHLTPDMPKIDLSSIAARLQSPSKSKSKFMIKARFYVSLSPPLQARLYSEMELMIVATANEYLQTQQREGRMSVDSLTRVLESWVSKNRPQVIEFLFDQTTQRDLILYNLRTFRFYGPHADNLISINCMMQCWKALAREMSVRNFCTPDAVVRKNLVDAYKVLEMLGAPMITMVAFSDIREQMEGIITEKTYARREYEKMKFGVEVKWEPPVEDRERVDFNPFA